MENREIHAKPFTNMEISAFCGQIALVLKSGISSIEGITIMVEDAPEGEERQILEQILEKMQETGSLYDSLSDTGLFPSYMLHMVEIGEETGTLDDVMEALSSHYDREDAIGKSIKSAVTYPLIMAGMMIAVIIVLLVKVMPIFNQVFVQLGTEMTGFSRMLMDLGNISLFEPDNAEVRERVREAADCLLRWQDADGSWAVAYDDATGRKAFEDLKDYRPTFYGLLIAYRILGDEKYLAAARRGADWLIENAVGPDKWLGVCGDTRFAADFATAQAAEALMELADITGERRYLEAAVRTARFYTTSVYTNPIASERDVTVKGVPRKQWEITTSGLSYEHGGIIGSANLHGPILLASHAGMFVRMFRLTGDRIFLDMARAAAVGRDAFVDDETAVASYYWNAMNRGAGPYPHHAWWQMGWITDYLLAELEARSDGKISFPAGFITPKVGPHRTFGFAPGKVYGEEARLVMIPGFAKSDNPNVEVLLAETDAEIILMLMNDLGASQSASITINSGDTRKVSLPPYGLQTIKVKKN